MTATLAKTATGSGGLDDVTLGRLPAGRPTRPCGAAGCGKTLVTMPFLVQSARTGEPGPVASAARRMGVDLGLDLVPVARAS